jgi:hypothetical protein
LRKPDYDDVIERLHAVADDYGGQLTQYAEADGYPLYHLDLPGPEGAPRFLLSAGIHGEEPGATTGFLAWSEHDLAKWLHIFHIEAFPCLNPWGFERGIRYDAVERDLNRCFKDDPAPPAVQMVRRLTEGKRYAMAVDMHEDCDYYGFYVYERLERGPNVAPALLQRIALEGPLSYGEEGDEPPIEQGLVRMQWPKDKTLVQLAAERPKWPLAFYLYHVADHVITVETPGLQPLDVRVRMQRAAAETALSFTQRRLGL